MRLETTPWDLEYGRFHYRNVDFSIGNYTVREVLMKNRTRVWRNVYNTANA